MPNDVCLDFNAWPLRPETTAKVRFLVVSPCTAAAHVQQGQSWDGERWWTQKIWRKRKRKRRSRKQFACAICSSLSRLCKAGFIFFSFFSLFFFFSSLVDMQSACPNTSGDKDGRSTSVSVLIFNRSLSTDSGSCWNCNLFIFWFENESEKGRLRWLTTFDISRRRNHSYPTGWLFPHRWTFFISKHDLGISKKRSKSLSHSHPKRSCVSIKRTFIDNLCESVRPPIRKPFDNYLQFTITCRRPDLEGLKKKTPPDKEQTKDMEKAISSQPKHRFARPTTRFVFTHHVYFLWFAHHLKMSWASWVDPDPMHQSGSASVWTYLGQVEHSRALYCRSPAFSSLRYSMYLCFYFFARHPVCSALHLAIVRLDRPASINANKRNDPTVRTLEQSRSQMHKYLYTRHSYFLPFNAIKLIHFILPSMFSTLSRLSIICTAIRNLR